MTDMVIPPDSVIAAAEAMRDAFGAGKDDYEVASAALEAALPHLRPVLELDDEAAHRLYTAAMGDPSIGMPPLDQDPTAKMLGLVDGVPDLQALASTATRLGRELGRREAAEEIAARIDLEAARARSRHAPHTADGYANAAQLAREIATKEPK